MSKIKAQCTCSTVRNEAIPTPQLLSNERVEEIFAHVSAGIISPTSLPVDLYEATAKYLSDALEAGLEQNFDSALLTVEDVDFMNALRDNIYVFSAAKTHQQAIEFRNALYDSNGRRPFHEFKKEAQKIYSSYNVNYLRAEYGAAIGNARAASAWRDIEAVKDTLPLLRYVTIGDARVRRQHKSLDGIVRPVDDPFWNKYFMPLDWGCRCWYEQISEDEAEITPINEIEIPEDIPETFKFNAGKDKLIFSKDHPYFKVESNVKDFAKHNFGLPLPEPIEKKEIPAPPADVFIPAKTVKEAEQFLLNNNIADIVDYTGIKDLEILNPWNEGIFKTIKEFPELRSGFQFIGSTKAREDLRVALAYKDFLKRYNDRGQTGALVEQSALKLAKSTRIKIGKNTIAQASRQDGTKGLAFHEKQKNKDLKIKEEGDSGWFAKGAKDIKYIVDHELGHSLDYLLDLRADPDFLDYYNRETKQGKDYIYDNLSRYAWNGKNPKAEFIAEAWAEFRNNPEPRPIALKIGNMIQTKYQQKFKK